MTCAIVNGPLSSGRFYGENLSLRDACGLRLTDRIYRCSRAAVALSAVLFIGSFPPSHSHEGLGQGRASAFEPDETTKARLQPLVKGILAAWDKADVVCLGEDHGSKNDSDLRITLVEHPDFIHKVKMIMVEFANVAHQDILDRLIFEGEEMTHQQLRVVWADANGHEVWDAPIYERSEVEPGSS